MSQIYEHEALLRDPFEYVSATAYFAGAASLVIGSELAFVVPVIAYTGAAVFTLRGIQRFRQARKVRQYQKNLTRLPIYKMSSSQLAKSYKKQFLGMGFTWTAIHAQRIYDAELPRNEKYIRLPKLYRWVRKFVYQNENNRRLKLLVKFLDSDHFLNPWKPLPDLEGKSYLHAVGMPEGEEKILQPLSTRVAHTL
ncbi:hypothetical protein [Suttonella ornithocola]|uniref:Conjugative coupling factor TraD, PFGI-1 class n=1 Tax=Suttonella ornithocola TaxID=279832 RepID=A0A380MWV7_9GAMM|nr:hypothetical protein [Suttonella ornithocola]SUO96654.1 conjugative coupling factor TraD, PFGI-1 class [Suttonella ornithocola]